MITLKSKREIELLSIAGNIVYKTHKYLLPYIKEGIKTKELDKLKSQKSDLSTEIANLEKEYREMNSQITQRQNELKLEEIKLGKMDVKLDNLLLTLNENYSLTYERAKMEYELDIDEETARLTVNNLKAKIKEHDEALKADNAPFQGSADAEVVIVEFFDYAFGYCHRLFPELNQVLAKNTDVKLVLRPLAFVSPHSEYAAKAVLAANEQGKFTELHTALFTVQKSLSEELVNELAEKAGIDVNKMKEDICC